jgi:hypothetical protein
LGTLSQGFPVIVAAVDYFEKLSTSSRYEPSRSQPVLPKTISPERPMRYAYLINPSAHGIFVKRSPMDTKRPVAPIDSPASSAANALSNSRPNQPPQPSACADALPVQTDHNVTSSSPEAQTEVLAPAESIAAPPSTKLTDLLRAWIADVEWDIEVVYDADDQTGYLNTHVPIDGTDYRLYVLAEEKPQYLGLTIYNPLFIPEDRTIEALRLVNQINKRQRVGRMAVVSNHLQYRALIDVEGCEPGIEVLKNLYRNAYYAMKFWMPHLGKLIFAGVTAAQIHEELTAEESATRQ